MTITQHSSLGSAPKIRRSQAQLTKLRNWYNMRDLDGRSFHVRLKIAGLSASRTHEFDNLTRHKGKMELLQMRLCARDEQ